MSKPPEDVPQLPKPPKIGRELEMKTVQVIGVAMLALIVALAAFGLFGTSDAQEAAQGERLDLDVTYPDRFRYKLASSLDVAVTNNGSEPIPTVTIRFDRAYIDSFSGVQFTPSPQTITEEAYEVSLSDLAPGMAKRVSVDLQAEEYWRQTGYVEAEAGGETVRVDLETLVFP